MKGRVLVVGLACASCGLFPDVTALEGDASFDGATLDGAASDATTDANDASMATDASPDVGAPDASWAYESTMGNYVNGTVTQVSVQTTASQGDLMIVACDTEAKAGEITLDQTTKMLAPNVIGPIANQAGSLETQIFWGVLTTTPGAVDMTATTTASVGFLDCSINVYRGGTLGASVVAQKETEGSGTANTTCGPVGTVLGGLAFYVAVRYTCAGTPSPPFTQRQDLEGNPTGDDVPTTGASVKTTLNACNASNGDAWECLMIAMSP